MRIQKAVQKMSKCFKNLYILGSVYAKWLDKEISEVEE